MDISLYYQSYGNGFPLVLLHGNGGDSNYFAQQVPYFSRFRRVIALDTRGHGKSPRGTAPFSIRQFAEDLLHFLDEQNLPQVDLLGFSDGGNIALTFAAKPSCAFCQGIISLPAKRRRLLIKWWGSF